MKYNLILAAILLAGAAWFLWPAGHRVEVEKPLFDDALLNNVKEIVLRRGAETIRIALSSEPVKLKIGDLGTGKTLEVFTPAVCPPNSEAIMRLTTALRMVVPRNTIDKPNESFGLDAPEYSIAIRGRDSGLELELGREHPFSGRRYARIKGSAEIFLIDEAILRPVLDADFCDKTPFLAPLTAILRVVLENDGGETLQLRHTQAGWVMSSGGHEEPAETSLVEHALEQFLGQKVREILKSPDLESSAGRVKVEFRDQPLVTINLSRPHPASFPPASSPPAGSTRPVVPESSPAGGMAVDAAIAGSPISYRFGASAGRILSLKDDDLKERGVLRGVSFANLSSLCLETPEGRQSAEGIQGCEGASEKKKPEDLQRRFELFRVLSFESLQGRLFPKDHPFCELNAGFLNGEKLRLSVLGEVESMVQNKPEEKRPREYLFDLGAVHARGILSAEMAQMFCSGMAAQAQ